jgi:GntR family transcriptional regulator / MocR family aminotransferase
VAVAPAHQYPTGAVLSADRRRTLLAWARTHGGLVIEDDFDAEYRYDLQPIGSLQGLAPEHVIYGGSTSKTLAPSLRVGWIVVPPRFLDTILTLQQTAGTVAAPILQLALAEVIERGELDRHLRRQRRRYQRQRAVLLAALATELPGLTVRGIALEGRGTDTPALVLGYAGLDAAAARPAVAALAAAIDDSGEADGPAHGLQPDQLHPRHAVSVTVELHAGSHQQPARHDVTAVGRRAHRQDP